MAPTGPRQRIPPKRILVVEDDVVVAHSIRMVLAADGHMVEMAQDGEQALAKFKASEYDLIVADFKLGKMDGLELADAIKQHSPAKPIILITAYTEKIDSSMGEVSNVDLLLRKPVSAGELQEALRRVFSAV